MKNCRNCLLRVNEWKGVQQSAHGLCSWFLKKLVVPRPIPANVVDVGCKNWRPGKTYAKQLQEEQRGKT